VTQLTFPRDNLDNLDNDNSNSNTKPSTTMADADAPEISGVTCVSLPSNGDHC
jgi:hypothetical protein